MSSYRRAFDRDIVRHEKLASCADRASRRGSDEIADCEQVLLDQCRTGCVASTQAVRLMQSADSVIRE